MKAFQATPTRETRVNIGNPGGAVPGITPGAGGEGAGGRQVERVIVEKRVGAGGGEGKEDESLKNAFNYIDQTNINHLKYLVQKETSENISMIIAYIDPEYANQILSSLSPPRRVEVTTLLAAAKEVAPELLMKLNKEIKRKYGLNVIRDGHHRASVVFYLFGPCGTIEGSCE